MRTSYFALGYACNHNCVICPVGGYTRRALTKQSGGVEETLLWEKEIEQWLKNIDERQIEVVTLSGGEPTIQPAFFPVLRQLAKRNVEVMILSNGEMFYQRQLIERITDCFPKERLSIITSFHASNASEHEAICQSPGAFEKTIEGCMRILESGTKLNLKHCIHGMNAADSADFIHFINRTFPDTVPLILCEIDYVGIPADRVDRLKLAYEDLGTCIETCLDVQEQYQKLGNRRKIRVTETPLCITDPYYWKYYSANLSDITRVYADNQDGISLSLDVESECCKNYDVCKKCRVRNSCPGTWLSAVEVLTQQGLKAI